MLPGVQPSHPTVQSKQGPQPQRHISPFPGALMPRSWPPWGRLQGPGRVDDSAVSTGTMASGSLGPFPPSELRS